MVRISETWPRLMTGMIQLPGMPTPPASGLAPRNDTGPVEIQVMDERIDERDEPQDQHEGVLEQLDRFQPGEAFRGRSSRDLFLRRGVGEKQAVGGQGEGDDARHDECPARRLFQAPGP